LRGPAGVTALVLGELTAGGVALLFLTPLWHEVKPGFFKLTGCVILVVAVGAWGSAGAGLVEGSQAGQWSVRLAGALAAVTLVWVTLLFFRRPGPAIVSFLLLLAGAAFLGAVVDGLLLGHWYLTDRGLSRGPINRSTSFLIVAVLLEAAAVVAGGFGPTRATSNFNPLLTSAGLASWIALGMVGATALIAVLIRAALKGPRGSAVQAATGFFYLAVITALTAEFAAKVRFLR
jgi:hypothetical protein